MAQAAIFDIDGTLADLSHRLHHVTGGKKDYEAFFAEVSEDTVIEPIRQLLYAAAAEWQIVFCSGRPERTRADTEEWLTENEIFTYGSPLYMRADGDHRPDHVIKVEMLRAMREDGYDPIFAVDDRPSVVAMWRENGITCLQCRDWNEAPASVNGQLSVMIGPSGAGKTTWLDGAGDWSVHPSDLGITPSHVVSSDQIRGDLCGNFRDQTRNDEVFAALHAVVRARLTHGLPTVVDATNLKRKDRLSVVGLAGTDAPVRYIVIDRPEDEKRRDAGWRAELPIDLIAKHAQTFRSQIADILAGDRLPNIEVIDLRRL